MNGSTVFLVAFFTAVLTATGTVYGIERYDLFHKAPTETIVPDFHGLPEADARANAQVAHVAIMVASREPADAKPGSVIRQSINAGQHVPREHTITVVLADELPKVPSITGLAVAEATLALDQRGYKLQSAGSLPNPAVSADHIIDQAPLANTPLAKGASVIVHVSLGTGDVEVPKLVGVGLTKAKDDLEKLGVKPVVRWVGLAETPTDVVLNQKPAAGQKVKPGSEITLTVNHR